MVFPPIIYLSSLYSRTLYILLCSLCLVFSRCASPVLKENFIKIEGKAQGTTYLVSYSEKNSLTFEKQIDSIFKVMNLSLSLYIDSSLISKFNSSDSGIRIDEHLFKVFAKSYKIHRESEGAFDPTVKPLVNFWGFGKEKIQAVDSINKQAIDSLLRLVGFADKVKLFATQSNVIVENLSGTTYSNDFFLIKKNPSVQLDFNALAQGYTVDVIAAFLEAMHVENYLVEVGGEVRVKGKNPEGELWKIGIDRPSESNTSANRDLQAIVRLNNVAMATSGNYRKFYVKDGIKYAHTIDPVSGFPVQQKPTMLSVTVVANDCMSADGYATAFMAMGLEKTKKFFSENHGMEVYVIYDDNGKTASFMTEKMKELLEERK